MLMFEVICTLYTSSAQSHILPQFSGAQEKYGDLYKCLKVSEHVENNRYNPPVVYRMSLKKCKGQSIEIWIRWYRLPLSPSQVAQWRRRSLSQSQLRSYKRHADSAHNLTVMPAGSTPG